MFARFNQENWAVNKMVHHNEWADMQYGDFKPVFDAYEALFDLLVCGECGACIRVVEEGVVASTVRCDCGMTYWNLIRKKGS